MSIPQTFIQELVARADVVEVVGRYVALKKGGANFMGLCPFHAEKSPSFTVSPSKQFYHCFGCGKNGNAIGFLMEHNGMSFVEAVHDLAQHYGMQVPQEQSSPQDRARAQEQRQKLASLSDLLEKAAKSYRKSLRESPTAIAYLKGRGLTGEIAQRFGLGYAPAGWRALASVFAHYDDPQLVEAGLVIASDDTPEADNGKRYDRFRDRIMFPIRNVKGECIGFGGRVLGDEKPKYLNSPETPVFSKGRELYGLYEARQAVREAGYVLVTEGYMDVVALAQWGFPNAVATLGTACTDEHVQKLFRYTESVVFSFDGDSAGRRAARKALDGALAYAEDTRSIKFLFLPPEHDPDSFIRAHGKEAFSAYVAGATPLSQFLLETAREGCALDTAEGRAKLASQAHPLWNALPDGALKLQVLASLADSVQLSPRELQSLWNPQYGSRAGNRSSKRGAPKTTESAQTYASPSRHDALPSASRRRPAASGTRTRAEVVCQALVHSPGLWAMLSNEDHAMLCAMEEPYGAFCAWLEGQLLTQGNLDRATLLEALPAQSSFYASASVWSQQVTQSTLAEADTLAELRDVLNRMLVDRLKELETQAIASAGQDPQALPRYRELQMRRRQLEAALKQALQAAS
ncbi:DNA primase [Curvibacter sp. APW13]|uniref:DNA primase n=1 Tax=Curvibacter sp. APW13 TaxID=3077236 RepID=UPI0028DE2720|nr:DNA primase [Curvibacter sp. APW13]MDT8991214.1 DNA primase [Curvibacter sp. APW13]